MACPRVRTSLGGLGPLSPLEAWVSSAEHGAGFQVLDLVLPPVGTELMGTFYLSISQASTLVVTDGHPRRHSCCPCMLVAHP